MISSTSQLARAANGAARGGVAVSNKACLLTRIPRGQAAAARPGHHRRNTLVIMRSAKADELLSKAHERYMAKDLMAAAKLYEDALGADGATARQKQAALYGATAVHASFGDIELAQITLREGIRTGLDFEQALLDPDLPDLVTSPQMLIQLRRFNASASAALSSGRGGGAAAAAARGGGAAGARQRISGTGSGSGLGGDLGSVIGSATSDTAEVDTSVVGVLRRVALLLIALTALGVGLFYLGLEYVLKVS